MDRKLSINNKEANQKCIDEVITRIQDIDDTAQVGVIAAQDIIDIVMENIGPEMYNKGIDDTKKLLANKQQDLEFEIEELKQ